MSERRALAPNNAIAGMLAEIRLAAGFLTILPILPHEQVSSRTLARSYGWFPLVGFALGAVLAAENLLLTRLFGGGPTSALLLLTLVVLTGAVHLDALADTADALGAGRDRNRALEVMRDSRIGSFGAIAIFFFLALALAALAGMDIARRTAALWLAPGLARWAMVGAGWRIDYLRVQGAGTTLLASSGDRNFALATAIAAVAVIPVLSSRTVGACVAAALIAALSHALNRRWLGGVTGDVLGATGELVEVAALLAMAVI